MNLLFTSVGRRGYLLRYFRQALAGQGTIHAANSDRLAPGFLEADRTVVTPLIHDPGYIDHLLAYCADHAIHAVIPLFDVDIAMLAANEPRFRDHGVQLVCSNMSVAEVCNDKWRTFTFLGEHGFKTPDTYLTLSEASQALGDGVLQWPVFVKPRWGMGSIGVNKASSMDELRWAYARVREQVFNSYLRFESASDNERCVIIQSSLPGTEHGLDVVNDLDGNHMATFVKRKVAMRSGETDSAVTVDEPELRTLGAALARALGHSANLDVDVFLHEGMPYILEMNARFGGGYPFSHLAGADLPRAILHWLRGEPAPPECFALRMGILGVKDIVPVVFDRQ